MQRITTREPDDSQIEIAIIALKTSLPDEFPDYKYESPCEDAQTETSVTEPADEPEENAESQEQSTDADTQ